MAFPNYHQALKGRRGLSSLHIVSHGEAGKLWLGQGVVDSNSLEEYREDLLSWGTALTSDAEILLYGCNLAAGETGKHFVRQLSQLTGADVAASRNLTGSENLGGDWELGVRIGKVETAIAPRDRQNAIASRGLRPIAFLEETMEVYGAVLAIDIFAYASGSGTQNPWTGTPGDDSYTYTGTANFTGNGLAGNDTIVGGIGNA